MKIRGKHKPSRVLADPKRERGLSNLQGAHTRTESVDVPVYTKDGDTSKKEDHLILYAMSSGALLRLDLGTPDPGDEPGPIPAVALKHMEKGVQAALNEDGIRVGITTYERVASEVNPNREAGPPQIDDVRSKVTEVPAGRKITLALAPSLLADLAAGMASPDAVYLTLDFDKIENMTGLGRTDERWYTGAIEVTTPHDSATGIIMPMRPIGA